MGRLRRTDRAHRIALSAEQHEELTHGPAYALAGETSDDVFGRGSWFESPDARLAAWQAHRDRLIVADAAHNPGRRPWAFWALDLGRPDLAKPHKELDPERVRLLARRGDLYTLEVAELDRIGREARERIGTPLERHGPDPDHPNGWDKIEARVAQLMHAELEQ